MEVPKENSSGVYRILNTHTQRFLVAGLGYTSENFQIVVAWYNHFKNDLTDGEALSILRNAHISMVQNASTT
jgi:hypothetical protein